MRAIGSKVVKSVRKELEFGISNGLGCKASWVLDFKIRVGI